MGRGAAFFLVVSSDKTTESEVISSERIAKAEFGAVGNGRTSEMQRVYHCRESSGPITVGFHMGTPATVTRQGRARRRSKRLQLTVAVDVIAFEGQKELFREAAQMQCVNAHGGLVVVGASVAIGQVLRVVNRNTREQQDCRVVNVETTPNSKWAAGIEFLQPAGNFWQISFPTIVPRFAEDNCN